MKLTPVRIEAAKEAFQACAIRLCRRCANGEEPVYRSGSGLEESQKTYYHIGAGTACQARQVWHARDELLGNKHRKTSLW